MKIAVIGAMESEVKYLYELLEEKKIKEYYSYKFYEGKFYSHDLVVVKAGIGKVSSGMLMSALIANYKNFDLVINVGVSGGVMGKVEVADVVVADKLSYADVLIPEVDYEYGQMANYPAKFIPNLNYLKSVSRSFKTGMILTGDSFYIDENAVSNLINTHFRNDNVLAFDMESTALAQAAYSYKIDYLAIRAISDVIGSENQSSSYESNLDKAALESNYFLIDLLKSLK